MTPPKESPAPEDNRAAGTPAPTERLYYSDAWLRSFDATVLAVREREGAAGCQVALDRSAFYPSSGGQPNDTGTLGGARVDDVIAEEGVVWHGLAAGEAGPLVGERVHGQIDWARRYDHMQQHTGQHLLSQVFESLYGFETVSVHMGAEENTLDLQTPELEPGQILEAESVVRDRICDSLPVHVYFVDEAELAKVPLRRPPKVSGTIRIVEIDKYDYSACGGTHCRSTAEAGPIQILRTERRRGLVRVSFICGRRAAEDYERKHRMLVETAALFSSDLAQIPALVERNLTQVKEQRRRIDDLAAELARADAARLLASAETLPGGAWLVQECSVGRDATSLRALASALVASPNGVALLASAHDGRLMVLFARGGDAPGHMGNLLRSVLQEVGGNGGGRPEFAQGAIPDATLGPQILTRAKELLTHAI